MPPDSGSRHTEDDEHDRGFEFRWHREARAWLPDVGKLITHALWEQKWADERRLFPNRSPYDFFRLAEPIYSLFPTIPVARGGITYIKTGDTIG